MPMCIPSETELAWKLAEEEPFTVPDGCRMFGTGEDGGWFFEEKNRLVLTHSNENGGAVIHTYLFVPAE